MPLRPLLLVALLAPALPWAWLPAADSGLADATAPAAWEAAADTILRDLSFPPAAVRAGLAAGPDGPALRLGLKRIPIPTSPAFRLAPVSAVSAVVAGDAPGRLATLGAPGATLEAALRTRAAEWGLPGDSALFLPAPPEPPVVAPAHAAEGDELPRFVTDYADLALRVRSRMELGGDWTRFRPCDEQFRVSCNPTLIPQLSPDVRFGVQVAGVIADRVQVDVDFDQSREFDAANRINIFYQGLDDDILRRVEVGDVTFDLPRSRFLTEGIPAGNFGFQAEGQLGPMDFQAVWAQQRGDLNSREFRLTGLGDQRAFVQEDTLVLDDADYVRGQFFFLLDPALLDRYPHVDVLDLDAGSAPPSVAPGVEPIQLYRFEADPVLRQQVEGFIQADAVAEVDGDRVEESGWFRYLQPGVDYFIHPSGLWVALRSPLRRDEMLAVTYITAVGDTVGDYNPERIHNQGGQPELRLLKASGANHQPGRPTWEREMHQVYRVSSSRDVEPNSVEMVVSLGERSAGRTFKRTPSGEDLTFLQLFGLDQESPVDDLDPSFVYSPAGEIFADQGAVQGTFVVFPTLQPFAAPPPLPNLGLSADETATILGEDANRRIYEEGDPFERDNAGLYRLSLSYRLRSEGVISSFSLGALGIRDGSERIFLGDRLLVAGIDYTIDYDVGQVVLLEPEALFTTAPDAPIRASWEQRSLFQVSPTQVFGIQTHTALGSMGGLDVLGLYQSERTVVTRPQLGTEPASALLGGLNGSVESRLEWLDRFMDRVPGLRFSGESSIRFGGELALSLPNPNTRGAAFVDDFDAANELPVSLLSSEWVLGSAPAARDGVETTLPPVLGVQTAAPLTWQHAWIVETPIGDSVGVHEGYFPRQDIDRQIRVAGSEVREPGLLLAFGRDRLLGGPSWRSITTALSATGLDLTKTDFLEFYVKGGEGVTMTLDLGAVSEDAFFIDATGATSGIKTGTGEPWGLGILDQEADPGRGEIWSTEADRRGVWNESCLAEPGRIYRIADDRANCTRGNGRRDTEDLDGDGNLDVPERHLRYVVRLDDTSPFLARTKQETGTDFRLFRIPLQGNETLEVGGAFSEADLRAVKHLRITLAGSETRRVEVARMRLVGSRWIKRAGDGVLDGVVGDTLAPFGRLEVATVSRVTEGDAYQSPPGVLEELVDPTSAFVGQGIEFNEKSLGLRFEDVPMGGRAEVYQRFPQRPRNFLGYREARMWVVPRRGDFGPDRPHWFFFKVGSDAENFYLFRTRLSRPSAPAGVSPGDWLPEVAVDFGQWFELRRRAEQELLVSPRGPGDPPVAVWAADSSYAVVLKDRGRAPDLANVRELSLGVLNEGGQPLSGEIWIDELRLARPVRDAGVAGSVEAELDAGGVIDSRLRITNRGAFFRQLRDDPSYQTDRVVSLSSTLRLDRWAPAEWGIEMPLTVDVDRVDQDPTFLANSDVRADQLRDLRDTESRQTRVGLSFRKRTRTANPWLGLLVDGFDARVSYTTAETSTVTAVNDTDRLNAGVGWTREPGARDFGLVPDFAEGVLRGLLPGFLEDAVVGSRFRWTPERVSVGTSYVRRDTRIFRYERIIERPEDSLVVATLAPRETVEAAADVRFRFFDPLTADLTFLSTRDLLDPAEAVADPRVQRLIESARASVGGMDLGWETNRQLRTHLGFRPRILSWLRNDLDVTTVYRYDRNANFLERRPAGADTTLVLTRNVRGERDWRLALAVDPRALAEALVGPPRPGEAADMAQLRGMVGALRPLQATYQAGVAARYNRDPVEPGSAFQWGWADRDQYRFLDADTAATLVDRSAWTLATGTRLPGGATVDLGYRLSETLTLDTRSDRDVTQTTWPDLRVGMPPVVPPSFLRIQRVGLSSGYSRSTRAIVFGGRSQQRRDTESVQVPLDLSVTWLGSLVTAYRGAFQAGTSRDPTGDTEQVENTHRLSVSSTFTPPPWVARSLSRPVRMALQVSYIAQRDCRATAAREECVPFVDQLRRSLSLTLDTAVRGFEVGMNMSYDQRQSFVGQKTGSTQFQLGIFGQLEFSAGVLPGGPFS
ncbi:MAG: cell surface protein SprA [Longimicrobiales bacterium]